jgi:glyoxylase-like metal-dependent hydrolase (beta-lactamase superfamily II)
MALPKEQVAGVQRRRVGTCCVTALSDGSIELPAAALAGIDEAGRDAIYHAAGRRSPFFSAINGFLLQWQDRTVLIDTGAGAFMGPSLGRLRANLGAAGESPTAVDHVLLTHMHPDHIGGLVGDDQVPSFPRATLMVDQTEFEFWSDDRNLEATPETVRDSFAIVRRNVAPYRVRTTPFRGSSVILPGLEAVALPGHTPGHTGYLLSDGGEKLLIWGDIVHAPEVQCARPDVTMVFDFDPEQAARSRRHILERAVVEDLAIAGMHISFPGFSRVVRNGDVYRLQPLVWDYDL